MSKSFVLDRDKDIPILMSTGLRDCMSLIDQLNQSYQSLSSAEAASCAAAVYSRLRILVCDMSDGMLTWCAAVTKFNDKTKRYDDVRKCFLTSTC
jgi:hypothetical protein